MSRKGRIVGLIGLTTALVLSAVAGRAWCLNKADDTLKANGFTWAQRTTAPLAVQWVDLEGPLGSAEQLSIRGTWPISVRIRRPTVDLSQWMDPPSQGGSGGSSIPMDVTVKDLKLTWGDRVLMSGLSGPLRPDPDLSGPDGTLRVERTADGQRIIKGTAKVPLDLPELKGEADLQVAVTERVRTEISIDQAVISHPLIATKPLPPVSLNMVADWSPNDDSVTVDGTLGNVAFSAEGTVQLVPRDIQLDVSIKDASLSEVVAVFGSAIPEAKGSTLSGVLGVQAKVSGPPWKVDPQPKAQGLDARGVLPNGFRSRMVQWQARDKNGLPVMKETGPAHPDWTPLSDAGWMPLAVVASEDGGFQTHPGYDLGAIREAISQAKAGERLRGGSTLTQQLAKNLFLSSDRTLVRKLRELILALELERALKKPAILALYLNVVEFGPGIHGIRSAADAYFLKAPSTLSLTEAAWLASVLPAPRSAHARARAGKARRARMRTILDRMAARGTISKAQAERAKEAPLRFVVE